MFKLKDVINRNGATLDKEGNDVSYHYGYPVSIRDLSIIKARTLTKKYIINMLNQIKTGNLGIWIDKGLAYIDNSITLESKYDALEVGKTFNQISVWDWKKCESIYLEN